MNLHDRKIIHAERVAALIHVLYSPKTAGEVSRTLGIDKCAVFNLVRSARQDGIGIASMSVGGDWKYRLTAVIQ